MSNERTLPEINVLSDRFVVDVEKDELRLKNDPSKTIPFSQMNLVEGALSLRFLYHREEKLSYVLPGGLHRLPEEVNLVEVYHQAALDPDYYFQMKGISRNLVPFEMQKLPFDPARVRVIPKVDINKDQFFVSVIDRRFIDTINPTNVIRFKDCYRIDQEGTVLFYDPIARNISNHQDGTPGIHVKLPTPSKMDPAGSKWMKRRTPRPSVVNVGPFDLIPQKARRRFKPAGPLDLSWMKRQPRI